VLFEKIKKDNYIYGFTENYIKVRIPGIKSFENSIIYTKISGVSTHEFAEGRITER
jgi:hypothetical protein